MKTLLGSLGLSFGLSILLATAACGGDSEANPREACEDMTVALCTQIYTCLSPEELAAAGYPANEAACVTQFQQVLGCAAQTLDNACVGNEEYDAAAADRCTSQVGGLECTQLRDPNFDVEDGAPACGQVCAIE
jgi:hypothetical protein